MAATSSSKMTALRARAGREWSRFGLFARRALGCAAFASAWVGAWLLGVWILGSHWVYADAALAAEPRVVAPVATERAARVDVEPEPGGVVPLAPLFPLHAGAYALDGLPRAVTGACPKVALTTFSGDSLSFEPAARVAMPFRPRLVELERVVRELSRAFYGRFPSAILVAASYDCRSVSGKNQRLSEHALGNAIDVAGFRFPAGDGAPAFEVRVDRHWQASGDAERERHARFLAAVTQALLARDTFRTLLGPAHPDHADHFHFDMAPEYYVDL
jgi:Extensin-like protein C-terminus